MILKLEENLQIVVIFEFADHLNFTVVTRNHVQIVCFNNPHNSICEFWTQSARVLNKIWLFVRADSQEPKYTLITRGVVICWPAGPFVCNNN